MPSLETPVLRAARAAEGSWFKDGLENIYRGLVLLLISVDFFLPSRGPEPSLYQTIAPFLGSAGFLLFGVLVFAHRSLIEWMKTKITFPRIGYVAPPPSAVGVTPPQETGLWAAPLRPPWEEEYLARQEKLRLWIYPLVILGFLLSFSRVGQRVPGDLAALAWAVVFGLASKFTQPPGRSAWTALAICVSMGILVVLFPLSGKRPVDTLFPLLGGISTVIGIGQLVVFLFRHPRPQPTEP